MEPWGLQIVIGYQALNSSDTADGNNNIAIGYQSLYDISSEATT